jgi:hypothetical protein
VKKVKRKAILFLSLAFLMLFAAAAPALATSSTMGIYAQGYVGVTVSPNEFTFNDILYIINSTGASYLYGAPYPLGNSISSLSTGYGTLNLTSLTGTEILQSVDTYAAGTVEGIVIAKFTGGGLYIYNGSTFTCTLAGKKMTLTHGDKFGGLLWTATTIKQGTSASLAGFMTMGTSLGVFVTKVIVGDPAVNNTDVALETGMYK